MCNPRRSRSSRGSPGQGKKKKPRVRIKLPSGFKVTKGDSVFFENLLRGDDPKVMIANLGFKVDWEKVHHRLLDFNKRYPLLVNFFARGGHSSGYSWPEVYDLLKKFDEELQKDGLDPFFSVIFDALGHGFYIGHGWLLANESGVHDPHQDGGYRGSHRAIFNFGCVDKTMTFSCGGKTVTITIPHMSVVILSREGGGVYGDIFHGVRSDFSSWILVVEISAK